MRRSLTLLSLLILILMLNATAVSAEGPADLVIQHARIITVDDAVPVAQSFAVKEGKFVAVGSDEAIAKWVGQATKVVDLSGKTIVPGFIDAHCHPGAVYPPESPWASVDCRPVHVRSMDELIAALKAKADKTAPGQWIVGSRYQDKKLGRSPTRRDLDQASTSHPIIIGHASGHQSVCNSMALEVAKITAATKDPKGGRFGRDDKGEPDGLLQESAAAMVRSAMAGRPAPPQTEVIAAYREGLRQYISRGITSIHVAGASSPSFGRFLEQVRSDAVPLHLSIMLGQTHLKEAVRRKSDDQNSGIGYGAIKLFHGASVSAHTCWISEPYAGRPDDFGMPPARSQEALDKLIMDVHEAGLQACVHTNGDREIEMVLTAFERVLKKAPRQNHRHRLEHCSVLRSDLISRIKSLDLVVVPHSYLWELGDTMEAFGEQRWEQMHPWRSLLQAGVPMAAHSDSPVSTADPLLHIQAMVTRMSAEGKVYGPGQCISVQQALRAWTMGTAYATFQENTKGSITAGKVADFVVLSADPAQVEPTAIKDIVREQVFISGRPVHAAPGRERQ